MSSRRHSEVISLNLSLDLVQTQLMGSTERLSARRAVRALVCAAEHPIQLGAGGRPTPLLRNRPQRRGAELAVGEVGSGDPVGTRESVESFVRRRGRGRHQRCGSERDPHAKSQ